MATQTKAVRPETASANLLFIDHETSYNIGSFFQNRMYDVRILKILKHKKIISTAWSWLGSDNIEALALPMLKSYKRDRDDNKGLIKKIHELYTKADIIVGHNINWFDDKMSNTGMLLNDLVPPPHKTIDTLKIARDKFAFPGNRLDDLGEFLGLGKKVKHDGFEMWEKCMAGDPKAWKDMVRYNIGDVDLLKKIYFKFRPWMNNHPALKVREETNKNPPCPQCDERKLQNRGFNISRSGRTPRLQCQACGHWPPIAWVRRAWRLK